MPLALHRTLLQSHYFLEWLQWRYPRAKVARLVLAQPGTDSFYFAAHLERLPRNADLVLVDYLTNDLGILDGDTTPHTMRAVTERSCAQHLHCRGALPSCSWRCFGPSH